jgi:hypothetical protein
MPVLVWLAAEVTDRLMVVVFGFGVLLGGLGWARGGLRLTGEDLEVRTGFATVTVPWELLAGVRRDGDRLLVAWGSREVEEAGPFDAGALDAEDYAEQLGAMADLLRQRALAGAATDREVRRRPAPYRLAVAAYLALAVVALVAA